MAKRRGIPLPAHFLALAKACYWSNSDGTGFMIKRPNSKTIHLEKGFMQITALLAALKKNDISTNDEFVLHSRIKTHGLRSPEMTHPFIVSTNPNEIMKLDADTTKICIAHNGIFSSYGDYKSERSDTFEFVYQLLSKYNPIAGKRQMGKWRKKFAKAIQGQRLAIMYPDHELELLGRFNIHEGLFFSGHGYRNWKTHQYDSEHRNDYAYTGFNHEGITD
jgi:predicted glutamine amidotransferase